MILSCGISDCAAPKAPVPLKGELTAMMDKAKEIGFDGVEIHLRSSNLIDYNAVAGHAAKIGIKVTSLCTGMAMAIDGFNLTHMMPEGRDAAARVLMDFIRGGAIMGGSAVSIAYMKGPIQTQWGRTKESTLDVLYETLCPVVELCEKLGNSLSIEAANRFECEFLWTAAETLEFVNRFKSDHVTVHIDTFHMNIEEVDMEQAIRACKGKIGIFHFSDSDRRHPGRGHVDYKMVVETLRDIGFDGVGAFEFWQDPDGETAARRGLEHIKQFIK
jgi:sugar phosphate isomerase/epimerase